MTAYFICTEDELIQDHSRGFIIESEQGPIDLFVLKLESSIHAYRNHCPHLGIPLNWQPDEFLSIEKTHIQCSTHGALFTRDEGHCVAGPCSGQKLESLTLEQRQQEVWLHIKD